MDFPLQDVHMSPYVTAVLSPLLPVLGVGTKLRAMAVNSPINGHSHRLTLILCLHVAARGSRGQQGAVGWRENWAWAV